jgi:hypothetical protein
MSHSEQKKICGEICDEPFEEWCLQFLDEIFSKNLLFGTCFENLK